MRTVWIGRTSAVSISAEVTNTCSVEGCHNPGEWLHWRYRNADSEQGEYSMIEGWLFCLEHGRDRVMASHAEPDSVMESVPVCQVCGEPASGKAGVKDASGA